MTSSQTIFGTSSRVVLLAQSISIQIQKPVHQAAISRHAMAKPCSHQTESLVMLSARA